MKVSMREFAKKFRALAGDGTESIPDDLIVQGVNWAFHTLPSVPKLDKAFSKHYTMPLDARGHYRWKLNRDFRFISNSPFINFYTSTGGDPCPLKICARDNKTFYAKNGIPNLKVPGKPCEYTLERDYDDLYLVIDRPSNVPIIIDYVVWGYPKDVTGITELKTVKDKNGEETVIEKDIYIELSAPLEALILSTMRKVFYEEASDLAFAGSFGDYMDNKLVPEVIQMINKNFKCGQPIILGEH